MPCFSSLTLAALVVAALTLSAVSASRPGVIILPVGDSATAGDAASAATGKSADRYAAHLSYRRYLYHMLVARGYNVRFAGSKSDCATEGLDYDSRHEGHSKAKIGDIKSAYSLNQGEVSHSIAQSAKILKDEGSESVTLIRIVSAGAEDAFAGRSSRDISEAELKSLVDAVEGSTNPLPVDHKHTLVVPSPPPGGKRVQVDGRYELERDFTRDSRYEDFRFYLTWRGHFFERSKNAADCFSYFDFLRHYNKEGTSLNALGDTALARCIFDNLVTRKMLPKATAVSEADSLLTCNDETSKLLKRPATSKAVASTDGTHFEAVAVNRKLPPLTSLVAPAVAFTDDKQQHATCTEKPAKKATAASGDRLRAADSEGDEAAAGGGGAKKKGGSLSCAATPPFPDYEPYASTTKNLWKGDE